MIKLTYGKTGINVNKLHAELKQNISEDFLVTHNDTEFYLTFIPLFKRETDVLDENDKVIDTNVSYEKKVVTTETITNDDGDEVEQEVVSYEPIDFESIKSTIQTVIDNHDNTPIPRPPTVEERVDKLEKATGSNNKSSEKGIANRIDELESRIKAIEDAL